MSVLIVIPTVDGREEYLEKCEVAYRKTVPISERSFYIVMNKTTCGEAWNLGARFARKLGVDYVHMTADDLIPHAGWYETAVETVDRGFLPCARVLNPDGSVQVQGGWHHKFPDWEETGGGSVPFCRTQDWIDIPEIHYYSDNAYDYAQQYVNNYKFVARTTYAFTHHSAAEGRKKITDEERQAFEDWKLTL